MGVSSEDSSGGFSFPKNLSVWWNEETEYVLQRIERWAAYARGYNRLRSVRLSPGRMTMQEEPESRWSISQATNRLVVENNWSPSFRQRRQRGSAPAEQTRLNCCALSNLDYKSNGNLDSNCLEAYSLDHSIYFKTIGEIRSELRSKAENGNGAETQQQTRTTPLDCGDFLSSDFDDDDEELAADLDDVDFELREQLDQLELGCNVYTSSGDELQDDDSEERASAGSGVIQLCRSQLNEDEINNNIMMMGFQRKLATVQ